MKKLIIVLALLVCSPAAAQWQVPNNSIPVGRGPSVAGFASALPGTAGNVLLSTGASTPPVFSPPAWLASSVSFTQNGTGAVSVTFDTLLRGKIFTPEMFGGVCGLADNGPAIQRAVTEAGNFAATNNIPRGSVRLELCAYDVITPIVDTKGIKISGRGPFGSEIRFSPAIDNQIAYRVRNAGSEIGGGEISNITFYKPTNTFMATAIEIEDVSLFSIENVYIYGGVSQLWTGAGSIGLRTRGREFIRVSKFTALADRPIVISKNPNSIIDIDVSDFNDLALTGNTFAGLQIEDGVRFSRFNISNIHCALTSGCIYNQDTTSTLASTGLTIHNFGSEQTSGGGAAYNIYIGHTTSTVQTVTLSGYQLWDDAVNGAFFRNVTNLSLQNVFYQGISPLTCLSTDATVLSLRWSGSNFQVCSTSSFLQQNKIWSSAPVAGVALPRDAQWASTTESPTLNLTNTLFASFTVSGLPTCNAGARGLRSFVTDNNTALSFGAVITTAGAIPTPVWCDGVIWRQG